MFVGVYTHIHKPLYIYIYVNVYIQSYSSYQLHERLCKLNYASVCICLVEREFMFVSIRKNSYLNSPKLSYTYSFSHLQQPFCNISFLFWVRISFPLLSHTHTPIRTQSFRINVLFDLKALPLLHSLRSTYAGFAI